MKRRHIVTGKESRVAGRPTYSSAVVVGNTIYLAGQHSGRDADGKVIGKGDIEAQATSVLEHMKATLERAGATFADITKLTVYATRPEFRRTIGEVRARYLSEPPPASTFVVITELADPDFLVEIEAIAVIDDAAPRG